MKMEVLEEVCVKDTARGEGRRAEIAESNS